MKPIDMNRLVQEYNRVEFRGVPVWLPKPDEIPNEQFIPRDDLIKKCLAAWMQMDGLRSFNFRLYGPPGCGKNNLVYQLAKILKKDLYIVSGHQELRPEHMTCEPFFNTRQEVEYVGSPILSAIVYGGIVLMDEIGKAPDGALDQLIPLLDSRRTITCDLAGLHFKAHEGFLFCATLNEDEEKGIGLNQHIEERTRPTIRVGVPEPKTMEEILRANLPKAADEWFRVFIRDFINGCSPRAALIHLTYAYKFSLMENNLHPTTAEIRSYIKRASEDQVSENGEQV